MSSILIDGYNLIGIAHKDLEKARSDLVRDLHEYAKAKNHNITVVFDGWKDGQLKETRSRSGGVTVIYSRLGESADSVIKRLITSSAGSWIVVSSDREIANHAERKDLAAVTSQEFEKRLHAVHTGSASEKTSQLCDEDDDCDPGPSRKRGSPRSLSKRERRKLQALKKL
jgi:predicted RNA-binding protein with PIN domain